MRFEGYTPKMAPIRVRNYEETNKRIVNRRARNLHNFRDATFDDLPTRVAKQIDPIAVLLKQQKEANELQRAVIRRSHNLGGSEAAKREELGDKDAEQLESRLSELKTLANMEQRISGGVSDEISQEANEIQRLLSLGITKEGLHNLKVPDASAPSGSDGLTPDERDFLTTAEKIMQTGDESSKFASLLLKETHVRKPVDALRQIAVKLGHTPSARATGRTIMQMLVND